MSVTAYILCGGKGSRMSPFTAPKCLYPFRGVPIIAHILNGLSPFIDKAVLCLGYRARDVQRAVQRFSFQIEYDNAGEDASMAARLRSAGPPKERAIICYGDEMADVEVMKLAEHHKRLGAAMTVTTVPLRASVGIVNICADGVTVDEIAEKPLLALHVNVGYVMAEPSAWKLLPKDGSMVDWINKAAKSVHVAAYAHNGKRVTMNSWHELEEAEREWPE